MSGTTIAATLLDDPQVDEQLTRYLNRLTNRLCALDEINYDGWTARQLADALRGDSTRGLGPMEATRIIIAGLLDEAERQDPRVWGSPLGRVLAYWGPGLPGATTRACAAAALGCTRQNVMLMLRDGRLSEPADAGTDDLVSTASLAHAMRKRFQEL